jgi:tRNA1(Val) A37 N6-methylase TrmN6
MMKKTAPPARPRDGETLDTFYRGRVRVFQKKRGYRFSVDAPLLADFVLVKKTDEILEIGTGSGIISLLLSIKPSRRTTALEIQKGLADLAKRNVALNGLEKRISVVEADFRDYRPGRKFDLIVANPPYIRKATGFLSLDSEKSVAKHEIHGDLADLLRKAAKWLKKDGRACFVYPERRRKDFLEAASANGLSVRRTRNVHPRAGEPPNLFLIELRHAAEAKAARWVGTAHVDRRRKKPEIMPALILFGPDGTYTAEAEAIFAGRP